MWAELANGLDLLALVATLGALLQAGWLLSPPTTAASSVAVVPLRRRADIYFGITLGLLTLTTAAALLARSAIISGAPLGQLGPVLPQVLQQTFFGRVWGLRVAALVVLWMACWALAARHRRAGFGLAVIGLLVKAWGWSATAHPGDHGSVSLAMWFAVLHIAAAGLWGGTVLAVAALAITARRNLLDLPAAAVLTYVRRLSQVSAAGLALVVASGIFNTWSQLQVFADFWMSAYGRVLSVKLLLVLLMALIGAGNRYWRVPRLILAYRTSRASAAPASHARQRQALRRLLLAVVCEAALLLVILGTVSVLVQTMPPADANMMMQ